MRTLACLIFLSLPLAGAAAQDDPTPAKPPTISYRPLDDDSAAIYKDFLAHYSNGSSSVLNLARATEAFDGMTISQEERACLAEFHITQLATPQLHLFWPSYFPKGSVKLVEPESHELRDPREAAPGTSLDDAVRAGFAAGLFTFSEVVFDPTHTHAAVRYRFVCGRLCGHGGTALYTKEKGHWTQSRQRCGDWIS